MRSRARIADAGTITAIATPTGGSQKILQLIPVQLDQVTFSGTGKNDVYDDASIVQTSSAGNGTFTAQKFSAEHGTNQWQEPNPSGTTTLAKTGWQDPICYTSGSTITAAVQLKVPASSSSALTSVSSSIKVKGVGVGTASSGYNFTNTGTGFAATYNSTTNVITATGMTCAQAFPSSTVGYINPLTIQWSISFDGGTTWNVLNQSKDELFVTLNTPASNPTSDSNYKLYQTVLYYACSNAGATSNDTAVAKTWKLFSPNGTGPANICAWNPTDKTYDRPLKYYSQSFTGFQPVSTTAILWSPTGFGECYCFGQLFQDALWANGISNNGIVLSPIVTGEAFLVKDLTPSTTGSLPADAPFSWKMTFSASVGEMQPPPTNSTTYPNGVYGDFGNLATHYGQNTTPPLEKVFGNHYIVEYDSTYLLLFTSTTYFDPSYGVTYTGPNNFEDKSVQDYCAGISGDTVDMALEPSQGLHNIQFQSQNTAHQ